MRVSGFSFVTLAFALAPAWVAAQAELGRRTPSEKQVLVDRETGRTLVALTTAASNDVKLYQTHPQWAQDGVHILFRSDNRNPAKTPQAYAVNEITGEITQLTEGDDTITYSMNVSRLGNRLYYLRGKPGGGAQRLMVLDFGALLADVGAGGVRGADAYERVVATLPEDFEGAGGFALDADESAAYFGMRLAKAPPREPGKPIPQVPSAILAVDFATGAHRRVLETPFLMGHIQTNPWVPGEIIYCNETGGDAPQRIWTVRADGTGNRPVFVEQPADWVTHEFVADRDTVVFHLMGHTPELRRRPTGVMAINLRTDVVTPLGQIERGQGFWHSAATTDGRWAVADNFIGDIHIINRSTGEITLVSTGHVMKPDHAHPNFSPDGTRVLVQSGMLSGGVSLDLMLIPTPEARR